MSQPRHLNKVYAFLMFLGVSALCGVLAAGVSVPLVALGGGVTKLGADSLESLPTSLETPPQAEQSKVLMADGSVLATFYDQNRIYVPLDKISPVMKKAQVSIEDHRFYEHGAFDPVGTARAFLTNTTGGDTQGGSTLTQQYVKQVLINEASLNNDEEGVRKAQEATVERKVRELRYAVALEKKLNKDQILERYLNIAYYGDGSYGVEAAARHYYNTTAAKLTLGQSAMLAGIVQNPVANNPRVNLTQAMQRRNIVLGRMHQLKVITDAEYQAALKEKFDKSTIKTQQNGCIASEFALLCDYVRRVLISDKMPALGKTPQERENLLKRGGLTIRTLIDPKTQRAAESAIHKMVAPTDPLISGSVILQPKTGLIMAMAQNRNKMGSKAGQTYLNYNVEKKYGDAGGFQAGSTFKAFTIAAALESGLTPNHRINTGGGKIDFKGSTFKGCEGPFTLNGEWNVQNSVRGFEGDISMIRAAQGSVNTYFVRLIQQVGVCNTAKMAEKVGVKLGDGKSLPKEYGTIPSLTLGVPYVTPLSMAEGYATFANHGVHCDPIILREVVSKSGKKFATPSANCKQVIDRGVADGVAYVLSKVMQSPGTGSHVRVNIDGDESIDQAGKTGTTESNEAVWFAGFTPEVAGTAMISVDKASTFWKGRKPTLKNLTTPSGRYFSGSGSGDAGQIYDAAMNSVLKGKPKTKFTAPSEAVMKGKRAQVPDVSGMSMDEARNAIQSAGFSVDIAYESDSSPRGSYLGYAYPTGTQLLSRTIYLYVSSGPRREPKPVPKPKPEPKPSPKPSDKPSAKPTEKPSDKPSGQQTGGQKKP